VNINQEKVIKAPKIGEEVEFGVLKPKKFVVKNNRHRLLATVNEAARNDKYEQIRRKGKVLTSIPRLHEHLGMDQGLVSRMVKKEVALGALVVIKDGRENFYAITTTKKVEKLWERKVGRKARKPLIEGERMVARCIHEIERYLGDKLEEFKRRPDFEWSGKYCRRIHALMNQFYEETGSWEGAWARFKAYIAEILRTWHMQKGKYLWLSWLLKFETVTAIFAGKYRVGKAILEEAKNTFISEEKLEEKAEEQLVRQEKEEGVISLRFRRLLAENVGMGAYLAWFGEKVRVRDEIEQAYESEDGRVHRRIRIETKTESAYLVDKIFERYGGAISEIGEEMSYGVEINGRVVFIRSQAEEEAETWKGAPMRRVT
jgi:hypothetical protein